MLHILNINLKGAADVTQLAKWLLQTPEDSGLNRVIYVPNFKNIYLPNRKDEDKEKEVGNGPLFKSLL